MIKLFLLFSTVSLSFVYAQDKVIDLNFKEKYKYLNDKTIKDGKTYIISGDEHSMKKTDLNIMCFDSNLNLIYSKDIQSEYKGLPAFFGRGMNDSPIFYDMTLPDKGDYMISNIDKMIFDEKGNNRKYDLEEGRRIEGFETAFYIVTEKFACYFGNKIDKKKKDDKSDQIYFYRVNTKDLSREMIELKMPDINSLLSSNKDKFQSKEERKYNKTKWEISSYNGEYFTLVNKQLTKDREEDQYNIVMLDYDGKIIKTLALPVKLSKYKYFALSDLGFGSYSIYYTPGYGASAFMDYSATGNLYIEEDMESFYLYGLYTNEYNTSTSSLNEVKYTGFYMRKYNFKGEVLWEIEKSINDKKDFNKKQRPIAVSVQFNKLNDGRIGFSMRSFYEKYGHQFLIDSNSGKIEKENKITFGVDRIRLNAIRYGSFATGYNSEEVYGKLNLDYNSLHSCFLNKNVDNFLKSKKDDEANYNSVIAKDGIYMIEENLKKKSFRLLKFNW